MVRLNSKSGLACKTDCADVSCTTELVYELCGGREASVCVAICMAVNVRCLMP